MAKKKLRKGIFITFEGVEGCGKSTHARLIYTRLKKAGFCCFYTKEPGGTRIGDKIRKILLDPKNKTMDNETELFLFEASRSQVVAEAIRPALKLKMIVICDRFYDATMAYQGYGAGMDKSFISKLNRLATGGLRPDLTIVLDIGARKGLRRAMRKGPADRMERKSILFHNRVRRGYKSIAKEEPGRVKIIATKDDIAATQKLVANEVLSVIQRYKTSG